MNTEVLIHIFSSIPSWLAVIMIAMLPVAELRLSIPIAIVGFGLDPLTAFSLSVIGNMIPVIPLLLFLEPVSNFLRRWRLWDTFFTWLFDRTHRRHSVRFEKYGAIGLAIFVGMPLPVTGAWTGCAAAFVFGFKFKNALIAIFAGIIAAGLAVTTFTIFGDGLFNYIFQ
ncbi:putative membrane protein [Candidatus Methanoperedens nitroreducens]|uniref:Putative membrane protein n=1 Tax=Candidatus Methanoperedens nitratireducens TaxID=1392998 RepID=A0A062V0J2_9EURY|nr:small multi-drug export protein [Candidatus Methanoperedens nitroreducens]KCZ70887.1 putative membrane protein [Candidatus Methanoperedens nitroreducens]MDJ1421745.1 small multi-drug export protein [Candidatus Methanoperedens sp.]